MPTVPTAHWARDETDQSRDAIELELEVKCLDCLSKINDQFALSRTNIIVVWYFVIHQIIHRVDRSAGAFETCIIRWNLLIFLCDLTHWHCPLCPKNVGFEIFNRKQFKNCVAISIFYKNKSWNIFNHQIYMNSVSSKTSDKDFRCILLDCYF